MDEAPDPHPDRRALESEESRRVSDLDGTSTQIQAALLQMAENRRARTDGMMWQVPALALTAEAFLLNISLAPDTRGMGRMLAAFAGLIVVSASLQLMLKHRFHEVMYAKWLAKVEEDVGLPRLHSPGKLEAFVHGPEGHPWRDSRASCGVKHRVRRRLVVEQSSVALWRSALLALLAVDAAVFLVGLLTTLGLWDPL